MNVKFAIPERFFGVSVDALELGNRARNALGRGHIETIEDILDRQGNLSRGIKGMGVNTVTEVMNRLINYVICNLTDDELKKFAIRFSELNEGVDFVGVTE